jgi:Flp pilus assembly protein TadB
MAYLIGEVLVFLAAAALIGAGMAWLLQGLRARARERQLSAEIKEARSGRSAAEAAAKALATSLNDLRAEMERETSRLRARVAELEAMPVALRPPASAPGLPRQAALAGWRFLLRTVQRLAGFSYNAARRIFQ